MYRSGSPRPVKVTGGGAGGGGGGTGGTSRSSTSSLAAADSRGAHGGGGRSATPTNFSQILGKKDRAIQQLVAEESAALNYLARRGSEAAAEAASETEAVPASKLAEAVTFPGPGVSTREAPPQPDEAMANAERELAVDAEWKRIQQNTFTRWANEHLKQAGPGIQIADLGTDLSDGLKLIALIEVLSGKKMPKHNKKPNFRSQKLENVSIALEFLEREGVTLVNIDSTDIVDCKLKLILGLIWTLILHYAISMPMWDGPPLGAAAKEDKTPKQRLLDWVKDKMPDCPVSNFTSDWKDGKAVGALVDSVAPGLCPNWEDWDPHRPVENASEAMDLADKWLNIPKLLTPEEIVNPNVDEQSMMTYLSQFPSAKLKPGAPLRQKVNEKKVRAYGPGIEPRGLVAKAPANFTVETFGAGDGQLALHVAGPTPGSEVPCEAVFNNDRKLTYSCSYVPQEEGHYVVTVNWSKRSIPGSPYPVLVEGFAGDASKVTASGPGLQPEGVVVNRVTYFDIFTTGAGKGIPEVIILDPKGKKDSVPIKVTPHPTTVSTTGASTGAKGSPNQGKDPPARAAGAKSATAGKNATKPAASRTGSSGGGSNPANKVTPKGAANKGSRSGLASSAKGQKVDEAKKRGSSGTTKEAVVAQGVERPGQGQVDGADVDDGVNEGRDGGDPEVYRCEYVATMLGLHSVNVFYAGNPIPKSPFGVKVSPASIPSKVWANGRGLQPTGIRANETVSFKVHTEGAGEGAVGVKILGPGGVDLHASPCSKDKGDFVTEYSYTPRQEGRHIIMINFANQEIPRSPFEVTVGPEKTSRIKAYGPGLKGGIVHKPARFTVDTCGETGALGFSIMGPSQAKINVKDNGDGSADVDYIPSAVGEHAIHILCNKEDIPGSPYMAEIIPSTDYFPDKVKAFGPGLENGVNPKEVTHFTIDASDAGDAPLEVLIVDDIGEYAPEVAPVTSVGGNASRKFSQASRKSSSGKADRKRSSTNKSISDDCGDEVDGDDGVFDEDDKVFECTYIPREGQHKQNILINYGGVAIPGSPFHVLNDNPNDPNMVEIYGPGVENGQVRAKEPVEFTVDCSKSGPGDVKVNITSTATKKRPGGAFKAGKSASVPGGISSSPGRSDDTVPVTIVDNKDDTYTVTYEAMESGPHTIMVTLDNVEVPQSPIRLDIKPAVDLSKVRLIDFEPEAFVDCINDFMVDNSALPVDARSEIQCDISGPDGSPVDCCVNKLGPEGPYQVSYTPSEVGDLEVDLKHGGKPLPDSPFPVTAKRGCNPDKVKAFGPGLERGIVDEENYFTIETRNAGTSGLGLAMEGPSEATVNCVDNQDGSCTVCYVPVEEGDYDISIQFGDHPIPGSPFTVPCMTRDGKPKPNADKVEAYGPGLDPDGVFPGSPTHFTVDASNTGEAPLDVKVADENGKILSRKPIITSKGDGIHDVSYVPPAGGEECMVHVNYGGNPIPGSPFSVPCTESDDRAKADASKVKAYGPGLDPEGVTPGKPTHFMVDASRTGKAPIDVKLADKHGKVLPRKPTIINQGDGTHEVSYVPPSVADDCQVHVTYGGLPIPGSPFLVPCITRDKHSKPNADKVEAYGPGLDPEGVLPGKQTHFMVDASRTGEAPVAVKVTDKHGNVLSKKPTIINKGDGTHTVLYVPPTEVGDESQVHINYGGHNIPGSPFKVPCVARDRNSKSNANKVQAYGPGLDPEGVLPGRPTHFTIDASRTGEAPVEVKVADKHGKVLSKKPTITNKGDGINNVSYVPPSVGDNCQIQVNYGGQPIPGSPFQVPCVTRDRSCRPNADKVEAYGPGLDQDGVLPGKPTHFTVDASKTGEAPVEVKVADKHGKVLSKKPTITNKGDGINNVSYVPPSVGDNCQIQVNYGGQPIPGSPFQVPCVTRDRNSRPNADKVEAYGPGLDQEGVLPGRPTHFTVDASRTGEAPVEVKVEDKDGKTISRRPTVTSLGDGVHDVSYVPPAEEDNCKIHVNYGGNPIPGSPFEVPCVTRDGNAKPNADKVEAYGPGLDPDGVVPGKPTHFIVDASKTGEAPVEVKMTDKHGRVLSRKPTISDMGDGIHEISFVPPMIGDECDVQVNYGGKPIPGSPFKVPLVDEEAKPKPDANKVEAYGPGLDPGCVFPGKPAHFTVDGSKTGEAPVEVKIADSMGNPILSKKPTISNMGDGLHDVSYVPPLVGEDYQIHVNYGGKPIPGSPFDMTSNPDLKDVMASPYGHKSSGSRKGSGSGDHDDPTERARSFHKNGTGLQRRGPGSLDEVADDAGDNAGGPKYSNKSGDLRGGLGKVSESRLPGEAVSECGDKALDSRKGSRLAGQGYRDEKGQHGYHDGDDLDDDDDDVRALRRSTSNQDKLSSSRSGSTGSTRPKGSLSTGGSMEESDLSSGRADAGTRSGSDRDGLNKGGRPRSSTTGHLSGMGSSDEYQTEGGLRKGSASAARLGQRSDSLDGVGLHDSSKRGQAIAADRSSSSRNVSVQRSWPPVSDHDMDGSRRTSRSSAVDSDDLESEHASRRPSKSQGLGRVGTLEDLSRKGSKLSSQGDQDYSRGEQPRRHGSKDFDLRDDDLRLDLNRQAGKEPFDDDDSDDNLATKRSGSTKGNNASQGKGLGTRGGGSGGSGPSPRQYDVDNSDDPNGLRKSSNRFPDDDDDDNLARKWSGPTKGSNSSQGKGLGTRGGGSGGSGPSPRQYDVDNSDDPNGPRKSSNRFPDDDDDDNLARKWSGPTKGSNTSQGKGLGTRGGGSGGSGPSPRQYDVDNSDDPNGPRKSSNRFPDDDDDDNLARKWSGSTKESNSSQGKGLGTRGGGSGSSGPSPHQHGVDNSDDPNGLRKSSNLFPNDDDGHRKSSQHSLGEHGHHPSQRGSHQGRNDGGQGEGDSDDEYFSGPPDSSRYQSTPILPKGNQGGPLSHHDQEVPPVSLRDSTAGYTRASKGSLEGGHDGGPWSADPSARKPSSESVRPHGPPASKASLTNNAGNNPDRGPSQVLGSRLDRRDPAGSTWNKDPRRDSGGDLLDHGDRHPSLASNAASFKKPSYLGDGGRASSKDDDNNGDPKSWYPPGSQPSYPGLGDSGIAMASDDRGPATDNFGRTHQPGRDHPGTAGMKRYPGEESPLHRGDGTWGQGPHQGPNKKLTTGSDGGQSVWDPNGNILYDSPEKSTPRGFHPLHLDNIPISRPNGQVFAKVNLPSGHCDYPAVTDNGNGSIGVHYQPVEEGPHTMDVKQDGEHVQGSPYRFHATPLDSTGKVQAFGPGLVHGVCGDPSNFVISTKGAGAGGLSLAVEGPSKAEISCVDNKDGTVNVSYLPTAPGEYKVYAKFADEHIDGSPFTAKVTGEGKKRNTISVGSSSDLSLPGAGDALSDYDLRALNAYIVSPSGVEEPCFLKKLPKGNHGISFTPREVGEHLVSVKRNGKHIKNSPFKITVNPEDVGDARKVRVIGSGDTLKEGCTQQDNTFRVDTKQAGYGGLSLSVEGPSKAEIKCKDNEDGTLDVSYKPFEPGLYIVNLKFADQHVPGSPFAVAVSGEGQARQTENINTMREAVPITEVGSQCRLTFRMPGISCSELRASVKAPTGKLESAMVSELDEGLYAVNFVPYELGTHTVSVMYRDVDIPGSPFQFTVGPLKDGGAHRVHAGGPGLERGIQGQSADFNVWTREAGHGTLAISVEGPSKAEVDFTDRKDGSCHVSYVVEEPGEYSVGIKFNDQHIPDSPYKVWILPSPEAAERVRLTNMADTPVSPNKPQTLLLNMNGAGGDVECKLVAPSGREDDCFITPLGDGDHSVRFVPKEDGTHHLHVKLNGIHIPGSPFKLVVQDPRGSGNGGHNSDSNSPKDRALLRQSSAGASTVRVQGLGIDQGVAGQASAFTIDTSGVGVGTLSITVDGPSKVELSCAEVEEGYQVTYTPTVPGKYFVTVKYNGVNVDGSPFSVRVDGENGRGRLGSGGYLPQQQQQQQQSKRSSVTMETMQRTSYFRHQYSESRRATTTTVAAAEEEDRYRRTRDGPEHKSGDASLVSLSGPGLEAARHAGATSGRPSGSFSVDCSRAGNNVLYVGVYGPEVPCEEVLIRHRGHKRYTVDYSVKEKGNYVIFVKWGDQHVPGSPFHIEAS